MERQAESAERKERELRYSTMTEGTFILRLCNIVVAHYTKLNLSVVNKVLRPILLPPHSPGVIGVITLTLLFTAPSAQSYSNLC